VRFLGPTALVERPHGGDDGSVIRLVAAVPTQTRRVTVRVAYGASDVERAAESMDVRLSGEEVGEILAVIDGELTTLAAAATHSAVVRRIFDELQTVSHAHAFCDDD
jgi:hypothetical protein